MFHPGQLHLSHLFARDPFDKLTATPATSPATSTRGGTRGGRAGSQFPAMCGLIGPQDGDIAIPSEQVWLRFCAWTQLTTRKSPAQATVESRCDCPGYKGYFNRARPHQGIGQRIPCQSEQLGALPVNGKLSSRPVLSGLRHDCYWQAAECDSVPGSHPLLADGIPIRVNTSLHRGSACVCPRYNLAISPTLSMLDLRCNALLLQICLFYGAIHCEYHREYHREYSWRGSWQAAGQNR